LDNLPIKDIKPIVEVSDYSIWIFIFVVLSILLVLAMLIFLFKNKKQKHSFNLDNPKETAYKLIYLIRDKENSKEYIEKLHNYTYKKEVPPFDRELFEEIINKFKIKI